MNYLADNPELVRLVALFFVVLCMAACLAAWLARFTEWYEDRHERQRDGEHKGG